ncbi:MAG: hypothetical protein A2402_02640 [Candidatus Staskawiczbacteria bacterium RIFOXYC1_FULL_37_43]|nr:MAG: hypothetical protein A2813_03585 [Candidatus Staskawiczbacteria bacterium RIFCSPHIGHO2_01_FULL_37_17]OGZ71172.1 MAG: hypothetical protein A2891_03925 [Candidatus Staskawiczbacteria bacterium RIFCSPLOWO2_01_FULL_37_19]OGZ76259.1 MAG: hypothetical protein A2205_00590 [Candidatus Staskawiczbacteria bacterium RIFOXYA1_FULL_37_15]OGZ77631.1 MAG: hypothetical protein A2280_03545 [Candidatus Staskawiczbacteria bacterium RIFOXYA12_FULL_37_10]OGZ80274.1 MAG: hypothetical protein A2353_03300 [Can
MKNENNFLKGFTLIELMVVIVIIIVLSTFVTANVMVYLAKGKNAAIKGNMANLATYGGTYLTNYEEHEDYSNFCDDSKTQEFLDVIDEINGDGTGQCYSNEDNWCAKFDLITTITADKEKPVFCVDSMGVKKEGKKGTLSCSPTSGYRCP